MYVDVKEVLTLKGYFTQIIYALMLFQTYMTFFCETQRLKNVPFMKDSGVQTLKNIFFYVLNKVMTFIGE